LQQNKPFEWPFAPDVLNTIAATDELMKTSLLNISYYTLMHSKYYKLLETPVACWAGGTT
jgi:hypothetical protein